jgi:NAD dependent epimerase/dehydratase family enzyme
MFFRPTEPALVLKSWRIAPERLIDAGFYFELPTLPEAAEYLVRQWWQANL